MENHICKESNSCICDLLALEPSESCPVHGVGKFPPRCEICGRFMKYKEKFDTNNNNLKMKGSYYGHDIC